MKQRPEAGALLVAATLLVCATYLSQCRSVPEPHRTAAAAASASRRAETPGAETPAEREREAERKPKSIQEFAAEEGKEESAKIKDIAHALQTAGPQLHKTYGFPP